MRLTIATSTQGTTTIAFDKNTLEWNATNHSYINTGDYNADHLYLIKPQGEHMQELTNFMGEAWRTLTDSFAVKALLAYVRPT